MLNESNMPNLISTLLGAGGLAVILVAIINQIFGRAKTRAEAKKTEAEADRIKAETAKILTDINLKPSPAESLPKELKGWFKAGSDPTDYEIGVDQKETYHGKFSAYIKSRKESPRGVGTLMQMFKANVYAGKRLKMLGSTKSEGVEDWAGFWMRVDGPDNKSLSFDNMRDRPIKGTTSWTKCQIVLDVPDNSVNIAFGVLLGGPGRVWVSDIQFEVVSTNVPVTDQTATIQTSQSI